MLSDADGGTLRGASGASLTLSSDSCAAQDMPPPASRGGRLPSAEQSAPLDFERRPSKGGEVADAAECATPPSALSSPPPELDADEGCLCVGGRSRGHSDGEMPMRRDASGGSCDSIGGLSGAASRADGGSVGRASHAPPAPEQIRELLARQKASVATSVARSMLASREGTLSGGGSAGAAGGANATGAPSGAGANAVRRVDPITGDLARSRQRREDMVAATVKRTQSLAATCGCRDYSSPQLHCLLPFAQPALC